MEIQKDLCHELLGKPASKFYGKVLDLTDSIMVQNHLNTQDWGFHMNHPQDIQLYHDKKNITGIEINDCEWILREILLQTRKDVLENWSLEEIFDFIAQPDPEKKSLNILEKFNIPALIQEYQTTIQKWHQIILENFQDSSVSKIVEESVRKRGEEDQISEVKMWLPSRLQTTIQQQILYTLAHHAPNLDEQFILQPGTQRAFLLKQVPSLSHLPEILTFHQGIQATANNHYGFDNRPIGIGDKDNSFYGEEDSRRCLEDNKKNNFSQYKNSLPNNKITPSQKFLFDLKKVSLKQNTPEAPLSYMDFMSFSSKQIEEIEAQLDFLLNNNGVCNIPANSKVWDSEQCHIPLMPYQEKLEDLKPNPKLNLSRDKVETNNGRMILVENL